MINGGSSVFRTDQNALSFTNNPVAGASFGGTASGNFANIEFAQFTSLSEFIIFNADKTSDFIGIEGNIKSYYSTP